MVLRQRINSDVRGAKSGEVADSDSALRLAMTQQSARERHDLFFGCPPQRPRFFEFRGQFVDARNDAALLVERRERDFVPEHVRRTYGRIVR